MNIGETCLVIVISFQPYSLAISALLITVVNIFV